MPDNLISFEDAQREFISVRALELQKLGASTADITVTKQSLNPSDRDGLVSPGIGDLIPGFVEIVPYDQPVSGNTRYKVEILPVELIPAYEGSRAIAFYGTPTRFRISWDAWDEGDVEIWYDPVEDITQITSATDLVFPQAFWVFLIKKTALNLVRVAKFKLIALDPVEFRNSQKLLLDSFAHFEGSIADQVRVWEQEFNKHRSTDLNAQPHLRRTNDEVLSRGYNNVSGFNPLDLIG
jgi:hypothetical protein